uniref:Zinc finger CCHC domain-containing protein 7 n=1 Tax=Homalodisca liturata TaxID=320908 RepID=A0A1B6I7K4_9HEMI
MDHSWLLDDDDLDSSNSESETETQTELENRLYSIVHHNDLSQPLPPELAKHYSVHSDGNGEVVVTLNDSLEDIKLEESKNVNSQLDNIESIDTSTTTSAVGNSDFLVTGVKKTQTIQNIKKRFRYSDINLDDSSSLKDFKEVQQEATTQDINYFQLQPNFFSGKRNKQFANLVIPLHFQNEAPNWKTSANSSFISFESKKKSQKIIRKMTNSLIEVNPGVKRDILFNCAQLLFRKNVEAFKKNEIMQHKKAISERTNKSDTSNNLPETQGNLRNNSNINDNQVNRVKYVPKVKSKDRMSGSISLNISPFKPFPQVIDLVSEDEKNSLVSNSPPLDSEPSTIDLTFENGQTTSTECKNSIPKTQVKRSKKLSRTHIPDKWSKSMVEFYTLPSKELMNMDLSAVFEQMKKTTKPSEWKLDPRDQAGVYQRTTPKGKHACRRCPNCHERGHLARDCPKPKKTPVCCLCGESFHTDYSCPNKVCLKCGVYLPSNGYTGECDTCYYSTLECDVPCDICGKVTHRSSVCPDLWRSFHATTSGEKKIPSVVNENKRKYCCNCGQKGHFSHNCHLLSYAGQQTSPFVTNYSAQPLEKGIAEVLVAEHYSYLVNNNEMNSFLQHLSNSTSAIIVIEKRETNFVFRISGTFEQCNKVKAEIEGYVNTKKRKRNSPSHKKKKQRLRY